MKRPNMATKGISVKPSPVHKETQTEGPAQPTLVPIATPVFMPLPMQMFQRPYPVPVPVPLPIPVPIFIPTTRNSTRGVRKFLKKMKAKLPDNVFEAQILEMAGALGDNDPLDSDDSPYEDDDYDDENPVPRPRNDFPPQPKLPHEDVESIIKAGNIVPKPLPQVTPDACPSPNPFGYRGSPTPRLLPGVKRKLIVNLDLQKAILSKPFKFILQKKIIIGKETECHLIETEVAIEAVDSRGQL